MRAAYDFSPLYRSLIGADHMAVLVENALQSVGGRDYPPYDVEKTTDDGYRISLAVAGFRADELEITALPNLLVVRGRKGEPAAEVAYLHHGLALRPFEQRFELADHVIVTEARYADGLLVIELERQIPEALKVRRIAIDAPGAAPPDRLVDQDIRPQAAA
ncbi:Hsp20 family protein [Phenylobacterium sp. LjRoot164]|uniref:Hsp20 family protein n=1 Tax=unclassified Phenylobacterium TaxID=2640670 RepID=UPI003ECEA936